MHAKPQLHRFSLARFAARTREISNNAVGLLASHISYQPSMHQSVTHDRIAKYIGGMHRAIHLRDSSASSFSLTPYPSPHTSGSVLYFFRARITNARKTCDERKRVAATRGQIQTRVHVVRVTAFAMVEKRRTKYLTCGRVELALPDEMWVSFCISIIIARPLLVRYIPGILA